MKLLKKTKYIAFLILCSLINNYAQNSNLKFQHLSVENGLPNNWVTSIVQDYKGFLWIGTCVGLGRYDGKRIKNYFYSSNDSTSLKNNVVKTLFEDSKKNLWIGTYNGGISKFNREKENFIHFPNPFSDSISSKWDNILSISEDSSGILWIGSEGGLSSFDPIKNKYLSTDYSFVKNPEDINKREVFSTYIDNENNLLLGTISKFGIYDIEKKLFTSYLTDIPSWVNEIFQDSDGNYWLGTFNKGIFVFNKEKGIIKTYPTENTIECIFEDDNKNLWIGVSSAGLMIINLTSGKIKRVQNRPNDPNSISSNIIYSFYKDNSDVLWLGTHNGISRYNLNQKKFNNVTNEIDNSNSLSNTKITSIDKDFYGNFWISYWGNGIEKLDSNFNKIASYHHRENDSKSLASNMVRQLLVDDNNNIWVITDGKGLSILNSKTKKIKSYSIDNLSNYFPDNFLYTIFMDHNGTIWIGGWHSGIIKCELDSEFNLKTKAYTHNPSDSTSLSFNTVMNIFEDSEYNLWVSTKGGGLNKFIDFENNGKNPKFINSRLFNKHENLPASKEIMVFFEDSYKNYWIGTNGEGLQKYSPIDKSYKIYTKKDGLASDEILGLVEDSEGNLWVSTNIGLSKINIKSESIISFGKSDGIISGNFSHNSVFKDSSGILYFGTSKSILFFDPREIVPSKIVPDVAITGLQIFNKCVEIGEKINDRVILEKSILETEEIVLSYKESVFSIEFAALNFLAPEKNKFAYKMKGFEDDWRMAREGIQFETYTNLYPGDYIFQVKAANKDGYWNETGASLKIKILPPFYQTYWFLTILVILFFLSIIFFIKFRVRQIKKQNIRLEKKVSVRTAELKDEIKERKVIEEKLLNYKTNLESLVTKRTKKLNDEIEERKIIEQDLTIAKYEAEKSDRLKSEFLAQMSHEIRTPINSILNFTSLIKSDIINVMNDDLRVSFQAIESAGNRTVRTVDLILNMSEIQAETYEYTKMKFDLIDNVFNNLFHEFKHLAKSKGLELALINNASNLEIEADYYSVTQIFSNLIDNAIKYTKRGFVNIIVKKNMDGTIEIEISDSGIGIAKAYLPKLFLPFSQEEQGYTRKFEGNGLGLALVKKYCEMNNAQISVQSKKNIGTTFKIVFPI